MMEAEVEEKTGVVMELGWCAQPGADLVTGDPDRDARTSTLAHSRISVIRAAEARDRQSQ